MGKAALKRAEAALAAAVTALLAPAVLAQALEIQGSCRDGVANGAYELRMRSGQLRVSGAFAKGIRTGTFIFWDPAGARVAVVPYDDNAMTGTVALWYPPANRRVELPRKLEAQYAGGARHGDTRSWYADGKHRGEYRYERGELVAAMAWTRAGNALSEASARTQARRDATANDKALMALEKMVALHEPRCE